MALAGLSSAPALAAGTAAGTSIQNTASASYDLPGGGTGTVNSNTITTVVDQLVDLTLVWADPSPVVTFPDGVNQILTYTLTNTGNGEDSFTLTTTIGAAGFDPSVTSIVLDTNGNGQYDVGIDQVYQPGVNDPVLAADGQITIFVLSTIPADAADQQQGQVNLIATSNTANGPAGTTVDGGGPNGGDAVVGNSTGSAQDDGYYVVNSSSVALVKTATVSDPFGGTAQVPGSTITYTLEATVSGTGTLNNIVISDAIPAGTSYKPGTLTLQSSGLTDADDSDAGRFTGTGIQVNLGNLAAPTTRTVTFQVLINATN